jgi:alkanesulfonate monooxygenase SsuD/methylene tetrahydromethanopterin reductase-like flavin-dependent oxidoreductase (luciferase family)
MKRGLYLAPFHELADPRLLAELARVAESPGGMACSCGIGSRIRSRTAPWVALSAIAFKTDSLLIGPMITPPSRRRVQKVARETVMIGPPEASATGRDGAQASPFSWTSRR